MRVSLELPAAGEAATAGACEAGVAGAWGAAVAGGISTLTTSVEFESDSFGMMAIGSLCHVPLSKAAAASRQADSRLLGSLTSESE